MNKMGRFFKGKKGFTLIELITVMAIMAIAAALVLPNVQGMIKKTEESKIKSFCVEATSNLKNYTNLLILGEEKIPYEDKEGKLTYYTIKDNPRGLQDALNAYNINEAFQYYVLPFAASSATDNPSSAVGSALNNKNSGLVARDVMITCIVPVTDSTNKKTTRYELKGFWYYSYENKKIVYHYYSPNPSNNSGVGFAKLTKDGK